MEFFSSTLNSGSSDLERNQGETLGLDLGSACCGGWTGAPWPVNHSEIHGRLAGFHRGKNV
jgi:hypothetical protein